MANIKIKILAKNIPSCWWAEIGAEFDKPYIAKLDEFLNDEISSGKTFYPHSSNWFNAFHSTPFYKAKVIIMGQDPYHRHGQAHGLSFSVAKDQVIPPSLKNIYKEINRDLGLPLPSHGCLSRWAEQGVLLLNNTLTVEEGQAGSHQGAGWELLTDSVINVLNHRLEGLVFMLWGSFAQRKGRVINRERHLVLEAPHPSPLSAYRGFIGCGHFSKANDYLQSQNKQPIDWSVR